MDKLDKTAEGQAMKAQYKSNKNAKVKDAIPCPVCGKVFVKKQYAQAFCCVACKDDYHNKRRPNRHKDGRAYYREYNHSRRQSSFGVQLTEEDFVNMDAHYGEDDY